MQRLEPSVRPWNESTGQDTKHITSSSARLPSSFYDPTWLSHSFLEKDPLFHYSNVLTRQNITYTTRCDTKYTNYLKKKKRQYSSARHPSGLNNKLLKRLMPRISKKEKKSGKIERFKISFFQISYYVHLILPSVHMMSLYESAGQLIKLIRRSP